MQPRGISQLQIPHTWIASLTERKNRNRSCNHAVRVDVQGEFVS
jgi:hypothetical protein